MCSGQDPMASGLGSGHQAPPMCFLSSSAIFWTLSGILTNRIVRIISELLGLYKGSKGVDRGLALSRIIFEIT